MWFLLNKLFSGLSAYQAYQAPEIRKNQGSDFKSDIWYFALFSRIIIRAKGKCTQKKGNGTQK
jgi:hypothetical protein